MWTLAPGLVATTQASWGELRSLITGERWDVRPEDLALVRALAAGIPETETARYPELSAAANRGWAAQADSTFDATLRQCLEELDRRYAWCRAPQAPHEAVLEAQASCRIMHQGFAQHAALPETVARRAAQLANTPQNVLVIGDDDAMSVALQALGHNVTVTEHDLREPLPAQLVHAFDAFFADPLSGPGALRLHLARGLAALKPGKHGFICVSDAAARSLDLVADELSLDVTERYSDFNHYYNYTRELDAYVSDLLVVRENGAELKPAADEPYLTKGARFEDTFFETPSTRYVFKNIDAEKAQLNHIDSSLQLLERTGRLQVHNRSYLDHDGIRSYMVHAKEGTAVFIRVLVDARIGELFVAPADTMLENALLAVLFGTFRVKGTVVQKHRVRGSSVYTMT